MKGNIKISLIFVLMIVAFLPQHSFAESEYDGIWNGSEKIYIEDTLYETHEDDNIIIYMQDENNLFSYDTSFGIIPFIKSGNNWIISSSIETEYNGDSVIIDSATMTFTSSTRLTGELSIRIYMDESWLDGSVTISASKMVITSLSNGVAVTNLEGDIYSYSLFQIDIPPSSTNFSVATSGGTGDCDLAIHYSRPDFDIYSAGIDGNDEEVSLLSPEPGMWYVFLYGWSNYAGVTLLATYETAPEANFTASPVKGQTPFDVSFFDQSTGSIASWAWDFGDGITSTEQNPSHKYSRGGTYTVSLTVSGPAGSDTEVKTDFISARNNIAPIINLLLSDE